MPGFQAARTQSSGDTCGTIETYSMPTTHVITAIGDVVNLGLTADTDGRMEIAVPTGGAQTARSLGIVVGFEVDPQNLLTTGKTANAGGKARVAVDPQQLYRITQTVAEGLIVANVGQNYGYLADVASQGANSNLITSNMQIDASSNNTAATLPFRLVGVDDLDDTSGLYLTAIVRPNATFFNEGTLGV